MDTHSLSNSKDKGLENKTINNTMIILYDRLSDWNALRRNFSASRVISDF